MKIKVKINRYCLRGRYMDTKDCPIARALKAVPGVTEVGVGGSQAHFVRNGETERYRLPFYWRPSFITKAQKARKVVIVELTRYHEL